MTDRRVTGITDDWALAELAHELRRRDFHPTNAECDRAADYLDELREIKRRYNDLVARVPDLDPAIIQLVTGRDG